MIKKDIFFIQEGSEAQKLDTLSEDEIVGLHIPILEEQRREGRKGGVVFKTILQEADVLNKNKRTYKHEAIAEALKENDISIRNGNFIGELDHPSDSDPARFTKVEMKNACYRILKTEWDGNILYGVCETLQNTPGKDMKALIVENGMKLGFSLRAMGKTQVNPQTGLVEVVSPMRMFCYDCVSNPSHSNARMTEIFSENQLYEIAYKSDQKQMLLENESQMRLIAESYGYDFNDIVKNENVVVAPDSGLAIMKLEDTTIKSFIEESTLTAFLKTKNKYFI